MATNKLLYSEAENKVTRIETLADDTRGILSSMNDLIHDNVGNPDVWQGERSSGAFTEEWEGFAEDFPDFVTKLNIQAENLKLTIQNLRAADETQFTAK